uniref:hypothetical protein n=1 Tax=Streptomyces albidochromogenes TaxID=329524 RepID=UPI001ABF0A7D
GLRVRRGPGVGPIAVEESGQEALVPGVELTTAVLGTALANQAPILTVRLSTVSVSRAGVGAVFLVQQEV